MNAAQLLQFGLEKIGLELDKQIQEKMLAYLALMRKWNAAYNLTAITGEREMVIYHLLDSLAVLPYLWKGKWLDVGCGAGVPGAILAMARPEWDFTLLDSNRKKTSFVQQAIIELGLSNARVYTARVEDWKTAERFDGIIARAFADFDKFTRLTEHLLTEKGRWAAMRGKREDNLSCRYRVEQQIAIVVPTLDAARSLVIASRKGE